jgi:hypothetical protein
MQGPKDRLSLYYITCTLKREWFLFIIKKEWLFLIENTIFFKGKKMFFLNK